MARQELQELNHLDFGNIIGGPLDAVVKAQTRSSEATLAFLGSKLIMDKNGTVKTADFKYKKHFELGGQAQEQDCVLSVPVMTLVPIPCLRIAEATINFRAKLTSTMSSSGDDTESSGSTSNSTNERSSGGGIGSWFGGGSDKSTYKCSGTYSHTRKNMSGETHSSEYTLNIKIRAVQDQLPAGMERVLTMLENCIKEKPATASSGGSAAPTT